MGAEGIAIRVQGLGKRFLVTTRSERTIFKKTMLHLLDREGQRQLWALRDVSFEVRWGEGLGIIGPNGCGKTTLMMILAGIMDATEGGVEVYGNVRSPFLSLGAALQPELNVEDNIRLCGALLGLSRREMDERMGKIVEFGELEPYRYAKLMELSAGYKARVSFSTALHVDSDIVMVDESLTVGDIRFKNKCEFVFKSLREQGKTVLLISHEVEDVRKMCDRCLYLEGGRVKAVGTTEDVIERYLKDYGPKD